MSKQKLIKPTSNTIFQGDNLAIMRAMPNECVDLIYIDPPFFTQRDYKNIWGDLESVQDYKDIRKNGFTDKRDFFERNIKSGQKGLDAYLEWMRFRVFECHRILKKTGSFYLHLDYHAVHYMKVICDEIFGYNHFKNEITWVRGTVKGAKAVGNQFARNHDTLLFYTKSSNYIYNRQHIPYSDEYIKKTYNKDDHDGKGPYQTQPVGTRSKSSMEVFRNENKIYKTNTGKERIKYYLNEMKGIALDDVWVDILEVQSNSKEKTGWPTQKPIALLERIISASSKQGDIIFDCFAGCGTSMHAAHNLKRKWIGIDISPTAIKVNKKRLNDLGAEVEVITESDLKKSHGIDVKLKAA